MKYIDQIDLEGKRVLIRFDYNVPLDSARNITDDGRIRASLPTLHYALDKGAKIILTSHLGRPKGKAKPEYSLAPVARHLSQLIHKEVAMAGDCIGDEVARLIGNMKPGDVVLLENLRFHPEEEKNDEAFAQKLAAFADVYIDDAFGNAHRAHASNAAITRFVKECGGGFLLKKEVTYFRESLESPARPFIAIIGGSKVSGKLEALVNLIKKVDKMIIGGGMAFTFLKALGCEVGKSLVEDDLMPKAREVMASAKERGVKFYLPVDCLTADRMSADAETKIVPIQEMNPQWMGLDIGPATIALFTEAMSDAAIIVWNGPMGVFEIEAFGKGTATVAHNMANSSAVTIVGGGDTDLAVHQTGESEKITFISTGGGASLELLEGKELPGIAALEACAKK